MVAPASFAGGDDGRAKAGETSPPHVARSVVAMGALPSSAERTARDRRPRRVATAMRLPGPP